MASSHLRALCAIGGLAVTLSFTACSGSNTAGPAGIAGAAELRSVLRAASIVDLPEKVEVPPTLFALGQALFFDKELSGDRDMSCATCHWPTLAGADERALPNGVGGGDLLGNNRSGGFVIPRNSPSTLNTHLYGILFWDGRVQILPNGNLETPAGPALSAQVRPILDPRWELLAAQALFPVTSRHEMRGESGNDLGGVADDDFEGIWSALMARIMVFPAYRQLFAAAYPDVDPVDYHFAHAANAIAAFETDAFACFDSPFERFVGGDGEALTEQEIRGAQQFFGEEGRCSECHSGQFFSDNMHHNTGLAQFGPGKGDGATTTDDFGRERVTGDNADRYKFRTPTLLNIELTAPYGHDGQFATLEAHIAHYLDATASLNDYDITEHVNDATLHGTLLDNQAAVLAKLSDKLTSPLTFDVADVAAFLRCLTASETADLHLLVPNSVPSGLPVE